VDTTTKVAVGVLIVLNVSAALFAAYPFITRGTHWPAYSIQAHALEEEPPAFFALDNRDSVVYQAISSPGEHFIVKQDETEIVSLIRKHGTSNIEVNGSFYQINVAFVDTAPPLHLAVIYPVSIAAMAVSIAVLVIAGLARIVRKKGSAKLGNP